MAAGSIRVYYDLKRIFRHRDRLRVCCSVCRVPENFSQPVPGDQRAGPLAALAHVADVVGARTTSSYACDAVAGAARAGGRCPALGPGCMFAVMVVIGVWHGAGWQFVIWGVWNRRAAWRVLPAVRAGGRSHEVSRGCEKAVAAGLSVFPAVHPGRRLHFGLGWVAAPTIRRRAEHLRTIY